MVSVATVATAALMVGPWMLMIWAATGKLCQVFGHRRRLVTEPIGRYVTVGSTWRRVGGRFTGDRMEIPIQEFIPSGLPDRHVVRCRTCRTEFDS